MEFDIGNLLYVVITLVAIIVSLLGKKKKPKGAQSKPGFLENLENVLKMQQEEPVVMDLQDHEPDMFEEVEGSDYEPVVEDSKVMNEGGSLMEEYERLLKKRGGSIVEEIQYEGSNSSEPLEVIELEAEEGTDYFEIVKDFDAGTAVVYSAIINRIDY